MSDREEYWTSLKITLVEHDVVVPSMEASITLQWILRCWTIGDASE